MDLSRRLFLGTAATSTPLALAACAAPDPGTGRLSAAPQPAKVQGPLPPGTRLRVGFAISYGFNVIDMSGPWETFQDVSVGDDMPCELGTVAPSREIYEGTGGLRVQPRWSFADAPQLDIIVVGAQKGGPALHEWLRAQAKASRIVMSVCTGAFQLARAGLFEGGKSATTHHDHYEQFEREFPKVKLVRGQRFVDEGAVCSAGGLTSGVDLALHVVGRLFGESVSATTARYMEFVPSPRPA